MVFAVLLSEMHDKILLNFSLLGLISLRKAFPTKEPLIHTWHR